MKVNSELSDEKFNAFTTILHAFEPSYDYHWQITFAYRI